MPLPRTIISPFLWRGAPSEGKDQWKYRTGENLGSADFKEKAPHELTRKIWHLGVFFLNMKQKGSLYVQLRYVLWLILDIN